MKRQRLRRRNGLLPGTDVFPDDAYGTKFKSGSFDLLFSEGILEHFRDPQPLITDGKLIAVAGNLLRNNVREYAYPLHFFESSFASRGFVQRAVRQTPLHEFWILLYERQSSKRI